MPIIKDTTSRLWGSVLSAGFVEYDGNMLGCTKGGITLSQTPNITTIECDQKDDDEVVTGYDTRIKFSLTSLSSDTYAKLFQSFTGNASEESLVMGAGAIGVKMRDLARPVRIIASLSDGQTPSTDPVDILNFYEGSIVVGETLKTWNAKEQTAIDLEIKVYLRHFIAPVADGVKSAYAYSGSAVTNKVPTFADEGLTT